MKKVKTFRFTDKRIDVIPKIIHFFQTRILKFRKEYFIVSHVATGDCTDFSKRYEEAADDLEYMIDIKEKVLEDVHAIHTRFPCNFNALEFVEHFVSKNY